LIIPIQAQTSPKDQRIIEVDNHLTSYSSIKDAPSQQWSLESRMAALHVPAVSIAAIKNGRIDWARAYGVRLLGGPLVTPKTLFAAASISKPVTAMGVLKLVEEGKISLDVDVNQYLKRWKLPENQFTIEKKVTVRELLSHTSGIGTHNGAIYDPAQPLPTIIQVLNGEKPATTPPVRVEAVPGSKFAYSNGGYLVLCLLVEDVSGEPFAEFMKENVLKPIGMNDSTFDALSPKEADHAATAYEENGTTPVPPSKFYEPNLAAGGLWTTPTDLAKFLIELQRESAGTSHRVLHQATARLMLTPISGPSPAMRVGLGIEVEGSAQDPYMRHGGSAFFQDEMVAYFHGDGIVVMTSGGDGAALTGDVIRSAATVYSMPDFKSVEHSVIDIPPQSLGRYVGTYSFIKVAMQGGDLTAEIPIGTRPQRLYPESQTRFFVLNGPQILSFDLDGQGNVTGVEFSTQIVHRALKKNNPPK
jgi:CubicO group peptidase (beta-lactamase class C family)